MGLRIPRRKIANYIAAQLRDNRSDAIMQLAAFLVEAGRTRELELIVRDIEMSLLDSGVVIADIESAHTLAADTKKAIEAFLKEAYGASSVELRTHSEPTLLGGVKVTTADAQLDRTARRQLMNIKATKV